MVAYITVFYQMITEPVASLMQAFSKLKENRFPGEIELKELVARTIVNSRVII